MLAHDSRTLELARYFDIPYRLLEGATPNLDAADLYAEANYSRLMAGHRARWDAFAAFMAKHGLTHASAAGGDQGAAFDIRVAALPHAVIVSREMPVDRSLQVQLLRLRRAARNRIRKWVRLAGAMGRRGTA